MSKGLVPLIGTFGLFNLLSPFTIEPVNYHCSSITLISDLVDSGIDVYSTIYAPNNLSNDIFQVDDLAGVSIVTLISNDGPTIVVPSSYIGILPTGQSVPYNRLIIAIDLGDLPDSLLLTPILDSIESLANSLMGVTATTTLHRVPISTLYSQAESNVMEAKRLLTIQNTPSFYKAKVVSDAALEAANTKIRMLETALVAANAKIQSLTHI